MLTDRARGPSEALRFVIGALLAGLAFFGLLRLSWTEAHAVFPFTRVQVAVAAALFGTPARPIDVTLACSGADALALCLGAVLAYPVQWRRRLTGAAGGAGVILGLNSLRIGTLGRLAASPAWFNALHVYVWPAVLTLAIAGYVFGWMRLADRCQALADRADRTVPVDASFRPRPLPTRRFILLTAAFLFVFSVASPLYLHSPGVLALAGLIARVAAGILGVIGISTHAAANVLWTPHGAFLVTQECIATPLVPVYIAAVCAYSTTWRRLGLGVFATLPIFVILGILRLLLVALPITVVASIFFVHAFYQILLGAVMVCLAAFWRHGGPVAIRHALLGAIVGILFASVFAPLLRGIATYPAGAPLEDPQGAIAFVPPFQVGLYLALWIAAFIAVGWRRFVAGLALLEVMQVAVLYAWHALPAHPGLIASVRDVRGWAIAGPLLVVVMVANVGRAHD